ncbi:hypothetical protein [Escherichia phage PH1062]|nr:hypothetical protein [Escherichia phage PH1062]
MEQHLFLLVVFLSVSGITQTCRLRVMGVRYGAGMQITAELMTLAQALTYSWLYSKMSRRQQARVLQCQTDLARLFSLVFAGLSFLVGSFRLTMDTSQSMVDSSRFLGAVLRLELLEAITTYVIRAFACLEVLSGQFPAL